MRAIRKKTESRRGASLTFALLLFLVCAVLSSVIIVAATTAAGRISRLAESDQRYYAVTSAAEFIKDMVEGKPVTVVRKTVTTEITPYSDGAVSGEPTQSKVQTVYIVGKDSVTDTDLEGGNLYSEVLTHSSIVNDAAYRYVNYRYTNDKTALNAQKSISLSVTADSTDTAALNITAAETVAENAAITVRLNGDANYQYPLTLVFTPTITGPVQEYSAEEEVTDYSTLDDGTVTYKNKKVETLLEKTTLTWVLGRIRTG